jgi:hypothetical protein
MAVKSRLMGALRDKGSNAARVVNLVLGQRTVEYLAPFGDFAVGRQHGCQLILGDVHFVMPCFFS